MCKMIVFLISSSLLVPNNKRKDTKAKRLRPKRSKPIISPIDLRRVVRQFLFYPNISNPCMEIDANLSIPQSVDSHGFISSIYLSQQGKSASRACIMKGCSSNRIRTYKAPRNLIPID